MTTSTDELADRPSPTLPCPACATPTVQGKHCAECGTVAVAPSEASAVPSQREVADEEHPTLLLPVQEQQPAGTDASDDGPSLLDVEDADLLDDLVAYDDRGTPDEGEPATTHRRAVPPALVAAALVVVVVLVAAGVLLTRHLAGSASRESIAVGAREFSTVLAALAAADDAEQVARAADSAPAAADRVEARLRVLRSREGAEERSTAEQLAAQAQVLRAFGGLTALAREPMRTWADSHGPIEAALERERTSRAVFATFHAEAAASLPDTARTLAAVAEAVGGSLAEAAVAEAGSLLRALGQATDTEALRAVAGLAAAEQAPAAAVLVALDGSPDRRALAAYSRALAALAGLSSLNGETASAWPPARADLTAALGELAGASDGGGALAAQTTTTFSAVDAVVDRAAARIADWKAAHEAAIADRNADAAAMSAYADSLRAQLKAYELLRSDLQAFFDRVEDPNVSVTYGEAYVVLSQAEQDRREARDELAALRPPDGVRAQHGELISVVNRAIAAVQAGYDGLSQADECYEYCYYRDTPGFARFQDESTGITRAFAEAVQDWESTTTAVTASIANRELPAKPDV